MKTEKELYKLKEKVEKAKIEVSELKGHKSALEKQLKKDWGCDSVEEAEKKLETMKKEVAKLDKDIEAGIEELEEKYNV